MTEKPGRRSRVPTGRLERLARIGWMTGELALGGATEGARRLLGSGSSDESVFLNPVSAERLARRLSRMRGAAMKIGQMLSLADDQILPPEFADALAILRSSADMMPESQVRKSLVREYGDSWEERFQSFDFEPIAAASIGQVHAATATDGRELALKIQYPGIVESIDNDVDNLGTAFRAARILPLDLDLDPLIEEVKVQLHQEADYQAEAGFLRRYRELISDDPEFVVPQLHNDLTTSRILAMERLLGSPAEDLIGPEHPGEQRDDFAARLLKLLFRELFEFRLMQTDPNFSNYLLLPDGHTLGLLDFGSTREIPKELSESYARLFCAVRGGDRDGVRSALTAIGFLREDDPKARTSRFVDLILLVFESCALTGPYDFGTANLMTRARDLGMDLVFRQGYFRAPPPGTMFLHRKLEGSLMLCARIGARVDVRSILDPFLG